jgi:hypothetical protein
MELLESPRYFDREQPTPDAANHLEHPTVLAFHLDIRETYVGQPQAVGCGTRGAPGATTEGQLPVPFAARLRASSTLRDAPLSTSRLSRPEPPARGFAKSR